MPHDIFDEAFSEFVICYYQNYTTVKQERKVETGYKFNWMVTPEEDQDIFFNLDYKGELYYPHGCPTFNG